MGPPEPPQQTSSTTNADEAQSAVTSADEGHSALTFKSPPPRQHRLPPKKRRFGFEFDFFDAYIKEEEKTQDEGEGDGDRVSAPESDATSIEDFSDVSSKRPRTGGAVEKGFIKNYVMSRAFIAPAPITMVKPEQEVIQQGEFKFKCKTCNKCFPTYQALGGHISNHNYQNSKLITNPSSTTNLTLAPLACEYKFTCKTCNKAFPTHRALGGHRSSHYDEIKGKMVLSATPNDNGIVTVIGDHRCNICNMSFPTGRALGGHKRLHWVKPSTAQDSASTSLTEGEMGCKMFDTDNQMEGADGINLELTL